MSTIVVFSVNMGCCVYINEEKKMNLNDLANGCNITKSEKFKGSEYFPYPLYISIKKIFLSKFLNPMKFKAAEINKWLE